MNHHQGKPMARISIDRLAGQAGAMARWRWIVLAFVASTLAGCATQRTARSLNGLQKAVFPSQTERQATAIAVSPSRKPSDTSQDVQVKRTTGDSDSKDGDPGEKSDARKTAFKGNNASTNPDTTLAVPPAAADYPIDLTTALRLAEVENPTIAEARQRIVEALGLQQGARVLMAPNLNAGVTYHGHTGVYQRSTGQMYKVSNQSLYIGGGAFAVAQTSVAVPAISINTPLTDALFEPLAARQNVYRTQHEAAATANSVLLEAATAYYALVAAEVSVRLQRKTEVDVSQAAKLTQSYATVGQGYRSDADRAATLLKLIHRQVQRAEEEAAVASAQLSRRLHLDPVVRVHPQTPGIVPVTLVDPQCRLEDLIHTALERRPEMSARAAAIETAKARLKKELARPWLPTLWLGISGGAFGGGSNIAPPLVGNFGGRTDIDVMAYWTLQNMGFGNLALQRRNRAAVGQAMGDRSQTITTIRREVAAALAQVTAARGRIEVTGRQLQTSESGFREDLDRLNNTVGRPIELTNSLELLSQARQDHLRAILEYNQAQLRLYVALGSPPPLERPATDPLPPAPVASPMLPLPPGMMNPSIPLAVSGAPPGLVPVMNLP